jgi:uncharacterized protein (TIGR02246 family)
MKNVLADQVTASLDRFCAAWKTNDGASLGSHFVEDGSLINPFGERADGRAAVSAMYTQYFGTVLRGTTTRFQPASIRPVAADHAFVDGRQTIVGADGQVVMDVHLSALLRRSGDSWQFVDSRPFNYTPVPR